MAGELRTLQAGRGLAAVAVVLYHLNGSIFGQAEYWPEQVSPLFRAGNSGVEFFFVISGFIMAWVHWRQLGQPNDPRSFLWKRFLRIYPPYWVALALVLVGGASGAIFPALTLWPAPAELPLPVAWTLQHEVLFYGFFALLLWRPKIGATAMALWLIPSLFAPFTTKGTLAFWFSAQHLLFAAGMGAAWALRRGRVSHPAKVAALGLAGFAAVWVAVALTDHAGQHDAPATWLYGAAGAIALLGLVEMERSGRIAIPAPLVWLGDASYALYLVHFPALSIGAKVLFATGLANILPQGVSFAALLVSSLAAGFAFHWGVERPLLAAFQRKAARMASPA